jgi:hypothetical protein
VKKTKEEYLPDMCLDGEEEPGPGMGGQEKGGRGRVQVVFVWLSTKGLRQISSPFGR